MSTDILKRLSDTIDYIDTCPVGILRQICMNIYGKSEEETRAILQSTPNIRQAISTGLTNYIMAGDDGLKEAVEIMDMIDTCRTVYTPGGAYVNTNVSRSGSPTVAPATPPQRTVLRCGCTTCPVTEAKKKEEAKVEVAPESPKAEATDNVEVKIVKRKK